MAKHDDTPARPDDVEPDPRTDGVGDGGERELAPPTDEDVARGLEVEQEVHGEARARGVADAGDPLDADDPRRDDQ